MRRSSSLAEVLNAPAEQAPNNEVPVVGGIMITRGLVLQCVVVAILFDSLCLAQGHLPFELGLRAGMTGVPAVDFQNGPYTARDLRRLSSRSVIGPSVALHLNNYLAIEFDIL